MVAVDLTTGPVGTGEAAAPQDVDVDDAMPGGGPPALAEDPDLVRGFCEYTEGNPYERPVHEAAELEPHTWELSETTGCTDYRIAVEKQDKSHHEIKVLHACLSYFYDALAEWSGLGEVISADAVGRAAMERVGNTLHGVFDLLERRRAELEVLLRARSALATEEDRAAADALPEDERLWITRLQAGRKWVWIEGNHDPGPLEFGGTHMAEASIGPLTFRHIAEAGATGEVSGHYHPKATLHTRGRAVTRPAFLVDGQRLILPAYGTYTGGLRSHDPALARLMASDAHAILTGQMPVTIPLARAS